ncbi:hypothetical protein [Komagataeibacter diospyri]|uniref:hypothetical protein n=1 Tax=Komagataeibacter diospyri TaxID=1932662 RepID=UPI001396C39C|nr:hypothetical protein [Komagataeibacter diospyri]
MMVAHITSNMPAAIRASHTIMFPTGAGFQDMAADYRRAHLNQADVGAQRSSDISQARAALSGQVVTDTVLPLLAASA